MKPRLINFFIVLTILISACTSNAPAFVDLPAPVGGQYATGMITSTNGDTLTAQLQSPLISVVYGETHEGPGAVAIETITILKNDLNGQMIETTWGDLPEGTVKLSESYDPDGNIVEGRISLKLQNGSIFQWFKGCFSCTIDQSRVVISFVAPNPGATPVMDAVYYFESWGTSWSNIFAMGTAARWSDSPTNVFPEFSTWGFWESYGSTDMVIQALYAARERLQTIDPSIKVVDEDSVSEIIGRQTGLRVYLHGQYAGSIDMTFKNHFGHMPNTEFIGKGSLSRIDFTFDDTCQTISVMNPPFPESYSSFFVFSDCNVADQIQGMDVLALYQAVRTNAIPGVHFGIYANGYIGDIVKSTGDSSVKTGEGGGVFYSVLGNPSLEQLVSARNLLSMMGRGGVDALGFGYATSTLSGNGIEYYLGTLILANASADQQLRIYGYDPGLLDRSGYLNLP